MMQHTRIRSHASLIIALVLSLVALFVVAAGCTSPPPQITIEDPYAELSPLFIGSGSFYMKIQNAGGRDKLVGVTASLPKTVIEIHDVKDNRMVRLEEIPVPARDTVELKPGSLHMMIFNMPKTIKEGSEVALTLRFERSGERTVPVRFLK